MATRECLMEKKTEAGSQSGPVTTRGELTRRKILDAAEEIFGKAGYYEASIAEITRSAGVAQGTYYIYFQNKREIFVELVEDLGKRLRTEMRAAISGATDRLQMEQRGFAAFFQFAARHRHIYSIVQEAERVAPEAFYAYYRGISRSYIQGLTAAVQEGNIRDLNPEAIAYTLMGIGHFVALRWLIWPQANAETARSVDALPDEIYRSVMDFIAHGLSREP